ncbi:MAG: tetratricopeptide repeat protein [Planctomycetota bacterium]|jgi:hypothetical protein
MGNKQTDKTPKPAPKSFMTVGPTLHYSHKNVQRCWLLALAAFVASCLFWTKLITGSLWAFNLNTIISFESLHLGRFVVNGISIFEYPWQILVLGLLMGILAIVPPLISQLMSFSWSLPFILAVGLLANLPGFALCLLISCIAVASRPLRFRSRFISIALCAAPQLIYWGYFGPVKGVEPVKWGSSYTPWICAWLVGLAVAGLVLGIGHFTRYRPGLVWTFTTLVLLTAVAVFAIKIGFAELDYQLYVAKNNPEQAAEFHGHSIAEALDRTLTEPAVKKYLTGFFYPTEPIQLRVELKKEIQDKLRYDRWPVWFIVPPELDYQSKKQWLLGQFDLFINRRPKSRRMPIALYYKAILSEYSPDIKALEQKEVLHFYSDYPHESSRQIWYRLYSQFSDSPESLEARCRIAKSWAGQGRFELANEMLLEAQLKLENHLHELEKPKAPEDTFFSLFRPPSESVMTVFKLQELQRKLSQLRTLISEENKTEKPASERRLAEFVMLNPHDSDYAWQLEQLLSVMPKNDPLRDNVLLAQIKLIADELLKTEKLDQLHNDFADTDGGIEALYELGLLKIRLWRQQNQENAEQKKNYLSQARDTLTNFIGLYPNGIYSEQVRKNLENLPTVD